MTNVISKQNQDGGVARKRVALVDWAQVCTPLLYFIVEHFGENLALTDDERIEEWILENRENKEEELRQMVREYGTDTLTELITKVYDEVWGDIYWEAERYLVSMLRKFARRVNCDKMVIALDCRRDFNRKISGNESYKRASESFRQVWYSEGRTVGINVKKFIQNFGRVLRKITAEQISPGMEFKVLKFDAFVDERGRYGIEADNIIGAYCEKYSAFEELTIFSNDSDYLCLAVNFHVHLCRFFHRQTGGIKIERSYFNVPENVYIWLALKKGKMVDLERPRDRLMMQSIRHGYCQGGSLEEDLQELGIQMTPQELDQLGRLHDPTNFCPLAKERVFQVI